MKVWKVTFDSEAIALDEEFYIRDASMLNSYVDEVSVFVEDLPMAKLYMTSWYGDKAELVDVTDERAMEMFHPNY